MVKAKYASRVKIHFLNMYILQVIEKSKNFYQPDYDNNHNHNVQDSSDFTIHRDIVVDKPENDTGDNKDEYNS